MSDSFIRFMAEHRERDEYWRMNLLPCIQQFLRSEQNEKDWSYCDMLFTAFAHDSMYIIYNDYHDIYMQHMQEWFRALSRDERGGDFRKAFDVPPRVRDADRILRRLEAVIEEDRRQHTTSFEVDVFLEGKGCDKKCRLFCLCLTYIVTRNNEDLKAHSAEWHATVVRGWFDEDNTEDARAFVERAETFFQTHGAAALQRYAPFSPGFSTAPPTAGLVANPYLTAFRKQNEQEPAKSGNHPTSGAQP